MRDTGDIPEVVGSAGVLVDPFDIGAISSALAKLINDRNLRIELRRKGLERALHFDWRDTARRTLAVYETAAGAARR